MKTTCSSCYFFGKFDSVIPPRLANKLVPRLKNMEVLHILGCGHRVMEKHELISRVVMLNDRKFKLQDTLMERFENLFFHYFFHKTVLKFHKEHIWKVRNIS